DRGRSAFALAVRGAAAGRAGPGDPGHPRPRPDPAGAGRPARRRARDAVAVGQGRQREPDPLLQGPGGLGRAHRGQAARLHPGGLRVHRQPRQLRGRARRPGRPGLDRAGPGRPGAGEDHPDRGVRRHPGRRRGLVRRREPAVFGAGRDRGVRADRLRQRQRPAVLRRGLQDPRLRGGRAAGLAAAAAGRRADGLRVAADQDRQGVRRADLARAGGGGVAGVRGAVRRLRADLDRLRARPGRRRAGEADRDRQVAEHRQPGRRAVRAGCGAADRRGDRGRRRRRDPRRHRAAGPHHRHLRRDRGRGGGGDAAQAAGSRGAGPGGGDGHLQHRRRAEDAGRGRRAAVPDRHGEAVAARRPGGRPPGL
ncbi:MAG: Threonine synthase, partial [uncultured Corynebacteriales bacterium]